MAQAQLIVAGEARPRTAEGIAGSEDRIAAMAVVPVAPGATAAAAGAALSMYRNLSLGTTGQVAKASAGVVFGWYIANNASAARFVKVYNKATAPTASDTPALTLQLPAGSAANLAMALGLAFTSGISLRASQLVADSDTTAPAANDVVVNLFYR